MDAFIPLAGGGGRIGVRGMGYHAPTPQAGRVTDSDGGGRVRVRDGGKCQGGTTTMPPCYLDLERSNWALICKEKENFYIDYEAFKQ
jgi:hypothetical protein